jgi:hypothetical protein
MGLISRTVDVFYLTMQLVGEGVRTGNTELVS